MKKTGKMLAFLLAAVLIAAGIRFPVIVKAQGGSLETTASQRYVENMGSGWNLGNSLDGFDADLSIEDRGENAWGNPDVTRELIGAVKDKGYKSIRIPMTVYRRYTVNENAGEGEYKYVINEDWLARYKEIVDWAVEEGLYVMVNIHHDSWIWLKNWDGSLDSEEYRMFTEFWKQLSVCFAQEPEQVCFETINEPDFLDSGSVTAQQKLDAVNRAAYTVIRSVAGNETRMIVMPTMVTNYEKSEPLYQLIRELEDEYLIATVHYYSEWVYSANLGKTGFDEELWKDENGNSYTPRDAANHMMETVYNQFTAKGIGVIVGEYGLLGYDSSEGCLQTGEELKYYEYMNELARQKKICLMFWDNGSGINRQDTAHYSWKKPLVGEMLENSMNGRSSYASGLDSIYFSSTVSEDVAVPLALNGNMFVGIKGLTEGTDYTYDSGSSQIILKKDYINRIFADLSGYGIFADLVMEFSSGADWHEYLIKYDTPVAGAAEGTRNGITIPVTFNGSRVRRMMTYQASGKVGPNSDWWSYLQYDGAFHVDNENGAIILLNSLFSDNSVKDGLTKLKVEFYDGQTIDIWMEIKEGKVISSPDLGMNADEIGASEVICLYAGETEIPSQYLYVPEGGRVYGTWVDEAANNGMVTLEGWPCTMIFDTEAHDNFVAGGIVIYYMDAEKYVNVLFGIKDAPSVQPLELEEKESRQLAISNLAEDAVCTFTSSAPSVADVQTDGTVTGKAAGEAVITVTVTQYNRTDEFTGMVFVKESASGSITDEDAPPTGDPVPVAVLLLFSLSCGALIVILKKREIS